MLLHPDRNILVLNGDLPIRPVLKFLANLSEQVTETATGQRKEKECLEPGQFLNFIVGSGNVGCVMPYTSAS
jgi:hypothetical protein